MSDLRIALIAEGKTDQIVIDAALKAIIERPFCLTLLQPETSDSFGGAGPQGGGWSGVYRWCRQLVSMGYSVEENPSLVGFDLILLHVDADVAGMRYEEAGINDVRTDLPCERPCPPAEDSVNILREVVSGWLDVAKPFGLTKKLVFCIPSKCSEAWVIAALYSKTESGLMADLECNLDLANWLSQRPTREGRLIHGKKKQLSAYRRIASRITSHWKEVCVCCTEAVRFANEVRMVL